jgi:hypothetical protein
MVKYRLLKAELITEQANTRRIDHDSNEKKKNPMFKMANVNLALPAIYQTITCQVASTLIPVDAKRTGKSISGLFLWRFIRVIL